MRRPKINPRCVADNYAGPGERIAEITLPDGRGCLLAVSNAGVIQIYRPDQPFTVQAYEKHADGTGITIEATETATGCTITL